MRDNLLMLRRVLSDRTLWPDDFQWDYADSNHCAIGLAREVGILPSEEDVGFDAETLGITDAEFSKLFTELGFPGLRMSQVTPEHAVDYIDDLLREYAEEHK